VAKVVVIDDMKVMRLYLCKALEKLGHSAVAWEPPSATEIVERLQAEAPDLVITDYLMPGCNGATIARLAKRARPELPVIVVTSVWDDETDATLLKQGAVLVLHKPVSMEVLDSALHQILDPAPS
jgi:CheY-like chemotaxis protein